MSIPYLAVDKPRQKLESLGHLARCTRLTDQRFKMSKHLRKVPVLSRMGQAAFTRPQSGAAFGQAISEFKFSEIFLGGRISSITNFPYSNAVKDTKMKTLTEELIEWILYEPNIMREVE